MILVDNRAGSSELSIPLRALGMDVEVTELEYGDLCWIGNTDCGPSPVGLELKTVRDLLQSMHSGRLTGRQIPGMLAQYSHSYLLIEGSWRANSRTGIMEEPCRGGWRELKLGSSRFLAADVESFLTSIDTLTSVRIRRSRNRSETLRIIHGLYQWWQKDWEDHGSLKVFYDGIKPSPLPVNHPLIRKVAAQLPGVGWERSAAVAKSFSSVAEMVAADESRWRQVEGIGKKLSARIVRLLRGEQK